MMAHLSAVALVVVTVVAVTAAGTMETIALSLASSASYVARRATQC
jgi:hypothetical protein